MAHQVAEVATEIEAARLLVYNAARMKVHYLFQDFQSFDRSVKKFFLDKNGFRLVSF